MPPLIQFQDEATLEKSLLKLIEEISSAPTVQGKKLICYFYCVQNQANIDAIKFKEGLNILFDQEEWLQKAYLEFAKNVEGSILHFICNQVPKLINNSQSFKELSKKQRLIVFELTQSVYPESWPSYLNGVAKDYLADAKRHPEFYDELHKLDDDVLSLLIDNMELHSGNNIQSMRVKVERDFGPKGKDLASFNHLPQRTQQALIDNDNIPKFYKSQSKSNLAFYACVIAAIPTSGLLLTVAALAIASLVMATAPVSAAVLAVGMAVGVAGVAATSLFASSSYFFASKGKKATIMAHDINYDDFTGYDLLDDIR